MMGRFTIRGLKATRIQVVTLWLLLPLAIHHGAFAADSNPREYEVKAALLYKLGQFATWPAHPSPQFHLCVYGENPFGNLLTLLESRTITSKPIRVSYFTELVEPLQQCSLIFISDSNNSQPARLFRFIRHRPILTISDISGFAFHGGIIELAQNNNRIQFKINIEAAKKANVQLASSLLELATIVDDV